MLYLCTVSNWLFLPLIPDSGHLEQQLEEASLIRRDFEEGCRQIKALEKQIKTAKQEKEDLQKVIAHSSAIAPVTLQKGRGDGDCG